MNTHITLVKRRFVPGISSPLIVDDLIFFISDGCMTSCMEAKSGKEIWKERFSWRNEYWVSPVYTDGKIYFCSKEGKVSVISTAREFNIITENELDNGIITSPAITNDSIIIRTLNHLYCFTK